MNKVFQIGILVSLLGAWLSLYELSVQKEQIVFHQAWLKIQKIRADEHEQALRYLFKQQTVRHRR